MGMFTLFFTILVFTYAVKYAAPKVMRLAQENPGAFKSGMYALKRMFRM
jgi:hypothetical protein